MKIGSPEFVQRALEVRRAKWGVACPPQFTTGGVKWVRENREAIRDIARSPERMAAWRARMPEMHARAMAVRLEKWGSVVHPNFLAASIKAHKGKRNTGVNARGPKHKAAKPFHFRSPFNQVFSGVNIRHFVRTHSHLFQPDDVTWVGPFGNEQCRASRGLGGINAPSSKAGSWKGWTLASTSRVSPSGTDLLQRRVA